MTGSQIAKLGVMLASGEITQDYIENTYGKGILTTVLALGTGAVVGTVVNSLMDNTGVSSVLDSVTDSLFNW